MEKLLVNPGDKYGRLTIISEVEQIKWTRRFLCKCDCGKEKVIRLEHLRRGAIISCGCYNIEKSLGVCHSLKHGHKRHLKPTRIYRIWGGMKKRCLNSKSNNYKRYGGRGINVCEEWIEFEPFLNWAMSNGYKDNLSIERKDSNGNYEPGNCKWANAKEQANNRNSTHFVTYKDKSLSIKQWSEILNINYNTLKHRLYNGVPPEEAFSASFVM
jgi:hypothetical protein